MELIRTYYINIQNQNIDYKYQFIKPKIKDKKKTFLAIFLGKYLSTIK